MTALTVLVGCVVVSFMLGVIVGRDQGRIAPMVDRVLPAKQAEKQSAEQASSVKQNAEKKSADAAQTKSTEAAAEKAKAGSKIMTAEELKYVNALKSKEQASSDAKKATEGQGALAGSTPAAESKPENAAPSATQVFDYVFQVSSLKDEKAVDKLRAELEGEGMRTRMSKSAAYYIVFVLVRGTESQAQAVRARLIEMKLGNPLQKQKTAVR